MNKIELVGFLLQNLRDDRGPDEEDLSLALCRETSKIFDRIILHGYLTRDMFDLDGIRGQSDEKREEERYAQYKTSNYPISYVVFANCFADWLLGRDARDRLYVMDLVILIMEVSWLRIKIVPGREGSYVVVRSAKGSGDTFKLTALVDD